MHACIKEDPRTLEIIISVDSDRRPFFPQCLVYASSGKLRGSGVPAREGHSLEERTARDEGRESQYGKIRNAGKKAREEMKRSERSREKRSVGSIPRERLCNTWRHSPVAFCAPFDRASRLGKSRHAESNAITKRQIEGRNYNDPKLSTDLMIQQ